MEPEDELLELGLELLELDAVLSLEDEELPLPAPPAAAELDVSSGRVGLPPPHAVSPPTPTRAAPPESRIRKSRRSVW